MKRNKKNLKRFASDGVLESTRRGWPRQENRIESVELTIDVRVAHL